MIQIWAVNSQSSPYQISHIAGAELCGTFWLNLELVISAWIRETLGSGQMPAENSSRDKGQSISKYPYHSSLVLETCSFELTIFVPVD